MHSEFAGVNGMMKHDFENTLRAELQNVPLETRKKWKDSDLHFWWSRVRAKDTYREFERPPGTDLQYTPDMLQDLIGPNAAQ